VSCADTLRILEVDPASGLSAAEAASRLRRYGRNQLRQRAARTLLAILLDQFRSAVILLLVAAAAVAMLFGETLEGLAILLVIVLNTAIGFVTEWRATRSMEALWRLGRVDTVVRRDGLTRRLPADQLVPGDIVLFEGGDVITADMRLLEASALEADESTLTGESTPVPKQTGALPPETVLMERANLLFKGTAVTRGSGLGVVTATGQSTELGEISSLVAKAEAQETPLEKRLNALGQRLVWLVLMVAALVALAGILAGRDVLLAIEVAIALAVAAIPEGLPVVATIALARGMWRMARRHALVVRLSAVETLGATGVILTDKTGTLTENRMTVSVVVLPGATVEIGGTGLDMTGAFEVGGQAADAETLGRVDAVLTAAALCSNASLEREAAGEVRAVGDPTEIALLVAAAKRGITADELRASMPELREEAFDPETKAMATFNRRGDAIRVNVKGAPESILACCTAVREAATASPLDAAAREQLMEEARRLAREGLRVLAVADREAGSVDDEPYQDLVFLGLLALVDPPRPGVKQALDRCRDAGVRVVMVTGDHAETARQIGINLGLIGPETPAGAVQLAADLFDENGLREAEAEQARVIARATPLQKLDLIDLYQNRGRVVAMTGDGVNDAPALKKADIGIAMGIRGTAVAKEASAMILQDDDFSTIVEAVRLGRTIYTNIRKFVVYLFSCNISEILVVSLATVAGAPLPLLPLQILFLNLVTDVFPALALGVGGGAPGLMSQKPRPAGERILTGGHWLSIIAFGALMSASVLGAMGLAIRLFGYDEQEAVTVSFCTLALSQLWHVFNMHEAGRARLRNEITANPWIWAALLVCLLLVLGAVYLPGVSTLLQLSDPGTQGWSLILVMSLLPLLFGPAARAIGAAKRP
jgi:Ca2+-transporting ATPase